MKQERPIRKERREGIPTFLIHVQNAFQAGMRALSSSGHDE